MDNGLKYPIASILVIIGIILFLIGLGIININLWLCWYLLLIFLGAKSLLQGSHHIAARGLSLLIIVLGIVLMTNSLNLTAINISRILEIFLSLLSLALGFLLLSRRANVNISDFALTGSMEDGGNKPNILESGSYTSFLEGIELDLRRAKIPEGETFLDLTAFMGGITIILPPDLPVEADGLAVLGGVQIFGKGSGGIIGSVHSEQEAGEQGKIIIIQAWAFLGGIEIINRPLCSAVSEQEERKKDLKKTESKEQE